MPYCRDVFVEFLIKTAIVQHKLPCRRDVFVESLSKSAIIQQIVPCCRDVFVEPKTKIKGCNRSPLLFQVKIPIIGVRESVR